MFSNSKTRLKRDGYPTQYGFSLIELLVTLAISSLIVSAVLVRFDAFDSTVVLKSIAYEIALTLREAQVFAVSVTGDASADFDIPYGVYFDRQNAPRDYIFFEDTNGNLDYDVSDTILETYSMNTQYIINDLCVNSTCSLNNVAVVFQRPEFDANINSAVGSPESATVELSLADDTSITFEVVVGVTGQISVVTP